MNIDPTRGRDDLPIVLDAEEEETPLETHKNGRPKLTDTQSKKRNEGMRKDAVKRLRDLFSVGGRTVYVTERHVTRSGMARVVTPWIIVPDPETGNHIPLDITQLVRHACGIRFSTHHMGLMLDGYDLEVATEIARSVSWVVFHDSAALKAKKF